MSEQVIVYATLIISMVLFVQDRIRYDLIAIMSLCALTFTGIVPFKESFSGFSNPAVITVGAILILSYSLERAGLVDLVGKWMSHVGESQPRQVIALCGAVTLLSAFINNVGAVALLMPVAIHLARKSNRSPSFILMPMAFASLLGGMITLIGTPPNMIVADFRTDYADTPFRMFDFTPVGGGVAIVCIAFITLIGWRIVPERQSGVEGDLFEIADYFAELIVLEDSKVIGKSITEIVTPESDMNVISLKRGKVFVKGRQMKSLALEEGDRILMRSGSQDLQAFITEHKLAIKGDRPIPDDSPKPAETVKPEDLEIVEAVVMSNSVLVGNTSRQVHLRENYHSNLLALGRRGRLVEQRMRDARFRAGDVLLLQMPREEMSNLIGDLGILPLVSRDWVIQPYRKLLTAVGLFAAAIVASSIGWLPASMAFVTAALGMVMFKVIRVQEVYAGVDWPLIVLLAALIPVGTAFETSGAAESLANATVSLVGTGSPTLLLGVILVVSIVLADLFSNAAAAIIMCPVGISLAQTMDVSADPFLMAVAVGAAVGMVTPIGHQSNTLVWGPGGYRFSDYFRLGLITEILVAVTAIPLIRWFWPF
ncbi:MAG: SLC13 family permease [Bythopirellula sp.]|nr:SLC13 family permease [Bythopirellula sp.]